jgi:copper chaperone NosL
MRFDRRRFLADTLAAGFVLTPLAGLLTACGRNEQWPEGMQPIVWDRNTCVQCTMVISDRRFAAQMRGGPKSIVFQFDEIGCAVVWARAKASAYPWMAEPATHLWVADVDSQGNDVRWLDARRAHYVIRSSPMGHNFGAVADPQPGSVDFETMREQVLAKYK